jgi:hypothetical protein
LVDRKTHHVKNCSWQLIDRSQIHTEVYQSDRFLKTCTNNTYESAGSIHFMGKYLTKYIDHIFCCNQCLSPLTLCGFASHLWRGVLDTTSCDKVCQWLTTGRWLPGPPVSSTNKTDRQDITEILLKVALNTINPNILLCLLEINLFNLFRSWYIYIFIFILQLYDFEYL